MSDALERFRASYASAFDTYLREGEEDALQAAYELGREAVRSDLSVLDVATIHHEVLESSLADASSPSELDRRARAAGDFFLESLSAFEMLRRGYGEARAEALLEKRQAATVRQLSNFLADASLAMGSADSLAEVVQLVGEYAREVVPADCCLVQLAEGPEGRVDATSCEDGDPPSRRFAQQQDVATIYLQLRPENGVLRLSGADLGAHPETRPLRSWLAAPLSVLDGTELGVIHLFDKRDGEFGEVDEAVLVQLAQMASAAVERARLYGVGANH